ncbi:2-hydroxyisoflavanone dehydratase-like [Heracleum sosnowskyi]|uniref:2-hydroxyisoflavanone dehydratase-like n=1 Tax=Heracleum sosnowskyi TaxID=360622 RepID=A0AAD8IEN7_9APIA|nr:2-hydroxyisoflavanone dehydratase-like [Heracleum sosnowskyi]
MASSDAQVVHNFPPYFQILKNGTVKRFFNDSFFPPTGDTPNTDGVLTRDVVVSSDPKVGARLFLPKLPDPTRKLPLLVYIHGGAFSIGSAFIQLFTSYVSSLVTSANVIAVSIEYRLAPENPIPACYEDSWEVLKWVGSHGSGQGSDPWLNQHADFGRVFLAGDSAGANIAQNMAVRVGSEGPGMKISGMVLVHPFFGNEEVSPMWKVICPDTSGYDDPRYNPAANPGLMSKIGCGKVLVCTAGNDNLKDRGWSYYEALKKSEWGGEVEMFETEGEGHVFHVFHQTCEKAVVLRKKIAAYLNN